MVNGVCYKPDSCVTTNFALSDENMQMIMDDIEEAKAAAEAATLKFEVEGEEDDNEDTDEDNGVTHKRVDGEDEDLRKSNVMYLSQNDYSEGTFRITKSGTYIITQDIKFVLKKMIHLRRSTR